MEEKKVIKYRSIYERFCALIESMDSAGELELFKETQRAKNFVRRYVNREHDCVFFFPLWRGMTYIRNNKHYFPTKSNDKVNSLFEELMAVRENRR